MKIKEDGGSRHRCWRPALLGAIAGGLFVAVMTRAIPRMMSHMMREMMARMQETGLHPMDMRQKMMGGLVEVQAKQAENDERSVP